MKLFKKENGHTLIELTIVLALVGIVLVFLWTNYLSIHRTYIRADKKAQNLEEARIIVNHITDNFQSYDRCRVWVEDTSGSDIILNKPVPGGAPPLVLDVDGEGFTVVKELIFTDDPAVISDPPTLPDPANPAKTIHMSYQQLVAPVPGVPEQPGPPLIPATPAVPGEGVLRWKKSGASLVIETEISSFKVRKTGDLLEFKIEVLQKGHGVIADQILDVGTTLNLKYMPTI